MTVFTVGHSNHAWGAFSALLAAHGVTAVADVRSVPYSRANPQYGRGALAARLDASDVAYVHLGRELGGRSDDSSCYDETGRIRYDRVARTTLFRDGIERVSQGAARHRIALLCAERQPERCHRALLVAQALVERGMAVDHINADASVESHEGMIDRLLGKFRLRPDEDLLRRQQPRDELVAEAILRQSRLVGYRKSSTG